MPLTAMSKFRGRVAEPATTAHNSASCPAQKNPRPVRLPASLNAFRQVFSIVVGLGGLGYAWRAAGRTYPVLAPLGEALVPEILRDSGLAEERDTGTIRRNISDQNVRDARVV
jgi:hypothetical protein